MHYLTHTRAVWLSFALVVILGVLGAVGFRTGYVLSLAGVLTTVTLTGLASRARTAPPAAWPPLANCKIV
jgi:hypothetical protein